MKIIGLTAVLLLLLTACASTASGGVGDWENGSRPAAQVNTTPTASQGGIVSVNCADIASDATVLQNAINSSPLGSQIDMGGTCLLTTGIRLLADRTYTGDSKTGTVLTQAANIAYVLASDAYTSGSPTTGQPITIENLTVACDGQGVTDGIIILNWQANVNNVDVNRCGGSGIVDTDTTESGRAISNTSVNSRFYDNFITGSGEDGFLVSDNQNAVTDGYFADNQIASSGRDGIHVGDGAGWYIIDNHLYGDGADGIYASRLYGSTISGNYIEDFGSQKTSGTWYGITSTVGGGAGSVISDNSILNDLREEIGSRHVYIAVTATTYGIGYLSVTGNVIVGDRSTDTGFAFNGDGHKLNVILNGNEVAQVGAATSVAPGVSVSGGI